MDSMNKNQVRARRAASGGHAPTHPLRCTTLTVLGACLLSAVSASTAWAADGDAAHYPGRTEYAAPLADMPPAVDGVADERIWEKPQWQNLTHRWLGPEYTPDDFQGRYKVVWSGNKLYMLAEFVDDVLYDGHRDPLVQYWNDDALEIFVDENFSGGDHQFNHNAFAYHVALDNQSIDVGTDRQPHNYSSHVDSVWKQHSDRLIWEVAIDLYPDTYRDDADDNTLVKLHAGKIIGLMVAYCDNDGSEQRENFVGSEFAPGEDKNRGWIDAGLFGKLLLTD
jgi:hypothetical protein